MRRQTMRRFRKLTAVVTQLALVATFALSTIAGKNVKGQTVVWLGSTPPSGMEARLYFRTLGGRARYATDQEGAIASIGVSGGFRRGGAGAQGAQGAQAQGVRSQGQDQAQDQ